MSTSSPVRKYKRDYGEGYVIDDDSSDNSSSPNADQIQIDRETSVVKNSLSPPPPQDDADLDTSESRWPIVLYVPNLMGYLRIGLSVHGLVLAIQNQASMALNTWIAASLLDLFDGIAARRLNQCSKFGVLLDVLADNILRTIIWIAAIMENVKNNEERLILKVCCWTALICLEWITMVCSQCNQENSDSGHWKDFQRGRKAPFWIEAVFQNGFRNLLGTIAIFGLFVAPFGSYVWAADRLSKTTWPWKVFLESEFAALCFIRSSYVGRVLCVVVEGWLCSEYICGLIYHDTLQSHSKQKKRR